MGEGTCPVCGARFLDRVRGRRRRFCSDRCRLLSHRGGRDAAATPGRRRPDRGGLSAAARGPRQPTPDAWRRWVLRHFQVDANERQLLELAHRALTQAQDTSLPVPVQLSAGRQFAALLRQLGMEIPHAMVPEDDDAANTGATVHAFRRA